VHDPIALITAQFEPISLEEINRRASLQVRADNKYFLRMPMFMEFMESLRTTHVMMEIDGQRSFGYDTQYFDTESLSSYWSHVQKRRKRFKCRSRKYVSNGLNFFEIKMKGGRGETVKHKMAYSEAEWGSVSPLAASFLEDRLRDFYGMAITGPMIPTVRTAYQRITMAAHDSTERVTCDFNLVFGANNQWQGRMADDYVLIETKSELGRGKVDHLLWRMGARPTPGSKYCLGLSLIQPHLRSNPFQQIRNTYFVREADPGPDEQLLSVAVGAPGHSAVDTHVAAPRPLHTTTAVLAD
jgi:hypothetical protein